MCDLKGRVPLFSASLPRAALRRIQHRWSRQAFPCAGCHRTRARPVVCLAIKKQDAVHVFIVCRTQQWRPRARSSVTRHVTRMYGTLAPPLRPLRAPLACARTFLRRFTSTTMFSSYHHQQQAHHLGQVPGPVGALTSFRFSRMAPSPLPSSRGLCFGCFALCALQF